MGHEGAGVVEEVGNAVSGVKPGDHVVIATVANCGVCPACAKGHPTHCRRSIGNITKPFTFKGEGAFNFAATSAFAEITVVDQIQAVKINKDVPLTSACLIGCGVITGMGAVMNRAKVQAGETAAVFGVGDVDTGAARLRELLGDADLRQRLGARAATTAAQFSSERMVDGYNTLYSRSADLPDRLRRGG